MDNQPLSSGEAGTTPPLDRSQFQRALQIETARVNRYGGELGVILFALDKVDALYEHLGQPGGEELLGHLTDLLSRRIRLHDVFARRATSEFGVLVPAMDLTEITGFAVKLRRCVAEYRCNGFGVLSASFGVTQFRRGEIAETFLQRATRALERAQAAGGNRISALRAES